MGNAVLLATNSIQIDRDFVIVSGDVIVNNATAGPLLGDAALSLDRSGLTPAGYKLTATSIHINRDTAVGGDVYYNTLTNEGTIAGTRFTPLALPVYATLPSALVRPAGSNDVVVPNSGQLTLDEGAYGNLIIGTGASVRLSGGGYAFRSISIGRGGALRYAAPADLVVSGRADFGANSVVQPENGSGLTTAAIRIQVDGINGSDGKLLSTPPAIHVGQSGRVFANLFASAGSLIFDQGVEGNGAFFARDILVGRGGRLTINSAFNLAPTANPQTVSTNGSAPLAITLTGSDPEGGALTFSIVSGPSAGTLSAPVSASATSANVTYTPAAANVADSFTFRVRDQAGATGDAIVTINPAPADPPTPNPTTVVATDSSAQTTKDVAATLLLRGTAPAGVSLTFSIVPNSGPFHGSLGAVMQGSEVPQRSAIVVYTPDAGIVGSDSFQFQACGVISNANVCDTATFNISVQGPLSDPPSLAHDVEVSTLGDTSVLISLGENSILTASRRLVIKPEALFLDPAKVAGNVADSNGDGFGDNANALPGSTPVFMSAGVNQVGGAGSNGTVRMQFEWDMTPVVGSLASLQSAQVILPTHRGSVDSLDTFFYWAGASGDGNLTNSDFEAPAEQISGAVMSVPETMPVNAEGTFSFGVLDQLRAAAQSGFTFFAIQGRVNEKLTESARGLEVRTTASGNVSENNVPMLSLATPGITVPLLYRITSLPQSGVLRDSSSILITRVPYDLPSPQVSYAPAPGFLGLDSFSFDASNGVAMTSALAKISVFIADCKTDRRGCFDGR
ncbi:MAG TPA: Ig-like domain-containing protein [Thermoanaerobaculia bacterium]|nr:Ig-like domain-containing protein [Thermoanaerobaculia bacterium]